MKKIVISIATASILSLSFTGCANNSLSVSSITSNSQEQQEFKTGIITKTVKVLINDRKMAALTGASVGGLGGAAIRNKKGNTVEGAVEGAVVGAVVGGIVGAFVGKEVVAYKTTIDNKYVAFLKKQLPDNTKIEFVTKGTEVSNVNVLEDVNNDTLVDAIDRRYKKAGFWNYHLSKYDITVKSKKKYYYLNDLVNVTFDSDYMITDIKKLKSGVINKKPKAIVKTIYKTKVVEKPVEVEKVVYKDRVVEKIVEVEKVVYKETPKQETVTKTETKTESIW